MQVEFQNTRQDYISFYRLGLAEVQWQLTLFIVGIAVLLGMMSDGKMSDIITLSIYILPTIVVVYLLPYLYAQLNFKRLASKNPQLFNPKTLIIADEGLIIKTGEIDLMRNWGSIIFFKITGNHAFIRFIGGGLVVIPVRAFGNDPSAINFFGELRLKIIPEKEYKPKPPYALGFLSIIPFIGGVSGLLLIGLGIFKYKDIWLVILGIIGVAATVIIGSLFLTSNNELHSKRTKNSFAHISQEELNSLVKEIEFYKLQHGTYPDSLQQLSTKDDLVDIYDPVAFDNKGSKEFNYHRIGKKYTLFSSGVDEIPGTADDIYPSIVIDTNKIGLVIKR